MIQPADILLYRIGPNASWIEKAIGWGQRVIGQAPGTVAYDHAAIATSHVGLIESYWPKVRKRLYNSTDPTLEAWRVKGITVARQNQVLTYAAQHVGEWYNLTGILTLGLVQLGHSAVCSQFVWEAFTAAGILLCPYETLESPDDIAASSLIMRVFP